MSFDQQRKCLFNIRFLYIIDIAFLFDINEVFLNTKHIKTCKKTLQKYIITLHETG